MKTNEPDSAPEGPGVVASPLAEHDAGPVGAWAWSGRARWLALIGGLLAGSLGFGIGEAIYEVIPAEKVAQNLMGNTVYAANRATSTEAARRNGALTFGVLGACLGACLGLAGGVARRSIAGSVAGTMLGAVIGLALGAGVSWASIPWFLMTRLNYSDYDIVISLGMHALIWGLLGASAGLAFAVGLGESRLLGKATTAGLVGAVLGAVAYELIGAMAFPMAATAEPISETWPTRLMARLLVALGTALVVALLLPEPGPVAEPAPQP